MAFDITYLSQFVDPDLASNLADEAQKQKDDQARATEALRAKKAEDQKLQKASEDGIMTPSVELGAPLNYINILQDLQRWRGGARGETTYFDFPGHIFFKIIFHFNNNSDAYNLEPQSAPPPSGGSGDWVDSGDRTVIGTGGLDGHARMTGLLGPSWLRFPDWKSKWSIITSDDYVPYLWEDSTAWSYFVMNDDQHRAQAVQTFAELLSNINSYSPWYFQKITGLDTAINRDVVIQPDFAIKNERDKISIECLPDAYDQRIGTLLDLYREIVWSWETKREMLPRNLRKFDMTIVAFQLPVKGKDVPRVGYKFSDMQIKSSVKSIVETPAGYAAIYDDQDSGDAPLVSYKAFEFHGCEIDYNSSKSGQSSLNNETGDEQKYNIDIFFDDMFEIRFNEFLNSNKGQYITDIVDDITAINIKASSYDPDSIEIGTIKDIPVETPQSTDGDNSAAADDQKKKEEPSPANGDKGKGDQSNQSSASAAELTAENAKTISAFESQMEKQRKYEDAGNEDIYDRSYNASIGTGRDVAQYKRPSAIQIGNQLNLSKLTGQSMPNIFGERRTYGTGILDQIVGGLAEYGKTQIKKLYLGNIAGLSMSKIRQQVESALDGNVGATVGAVSQYIRGDWDGGEKKSLEGRDIFPDPPKPIQIQLGNIFRQNTILQS